MRAAVDPELNVRVLYFDYPSLAASIAVLRAERALQRNGRDDLTFGGFDALGLDHPVPLEQLQHEELADLRQAALAEGLAIVEPIDRPATTAVHAVGELADEHGVGRTWRRLVVEGYWCRRWSLSDEQTLLRAADHVGLTGQQVRNCLADRSRLQQVRRRRVSAHRRGIGGVPALEIDGSLVDARLSDDQWDEVLQSW